MDPTTVLIDFDGVLHSYTSGWQGAGHIPDPPNDGAVEWLRDLLADERIEPVIFTTRAADWRGRAAIAEWLYHHEVVDSPAASWRIEITNVKKPAVMIIDDRGFTYTGRFPSPDEILDFTPWTPRP